MVKFFCYRSKNRESYESLYSRHAKWNHTAFYSTNTWVHPHCCWWSEGLTKIRDERNSLGNPFGGHFRMAAILNFEIFEKVFKTYNIWTKNKCDSSRYMFFWVKEPISGVIFWFWLKLHEIGGQNTHFLGQNRQNLDFLGK